MNQRRSSCLQWFSHQYSSSSGPVLVELPVVQSGSVSVWLSSAIDETQAVFDSWSLGERTQSRFGCGLGELEWNLD